MLDTVNIDRIKKVLFSSISKKVIICASVYFAWTFVHYVSTLLYAKFCTPYSFYGFVLSAVLVSTPQCSALRWMMYNGATKMNSMLLIISGYILAYVEENWAI